MAPKLSRSDEAPASPVPAPYESPASAVSNSVKTGVRNCIDCPRHVVVPDPDPTDWFCDDDVAVLCRLVPNPSENPDKAWQSGAPFEYRAVTVSCRPYNDRKECAAPEWCPLA